MTSLERSYRRWLRVYPKAWRAQHGTELLGLLLDAADARVVTRVPRMDRLDLLRNGARQRLVSTGEAVVPAVVRERVALYAVLSLAVGCVVFEVAAEWRGTGAVPSRWSWVRHVGPMATVAGYVYPLGIAAGVAAVLGLRRTARLFAAVAAGGFLTLAVAAKFADVPAPPLALLAVLCAVAGLGVVAPLPEMRPWPAATLAVTVAAVLAPLVRSHGGRTTLTDQYDGGAETFGQSVLDYYSADLWFLSALVLFPALVLVVVATGLIAWRPSGTALAIAVVSLPWLAFGLIHSVTVVPTYYLRVHPAATAVVSVATVITGMGMASGLSRRRARRALADHGLRR